ncbi:MAG: c-type cytochrome, partial [Betaproteobacteria bacterium]
MQKNNCTACHLIEKRKYGPKFKEVAQKYAGEPGAVETLVAKIKAGGAPDAVGQGPGCSAPGRDRVAVLRRVTVLRPPRAGAGPRPAANPG